VVAVIGFHHGVGHIQLFSADRHAVGFVAAGAWNRTDGGQNARQGGFIQDDGTVVQQAVKTVLKSDQLHAEFAVADFPKPRRAAFKPGVSPLAVNTPTF